MCEKKKWNHQKAEVDGGVFSVTHRALGDALLPLAHPNTLLQSGALLQHQVPAAVRVPGPHTRPRWEGGERRREMDERFEVVGLEGKAEEIPTDCLYP